MELYWQNEENTLRQYGTCNCNKNRKTSCKEETLCLGLMNDENVATGRLTVSAIIVRLRKYGVAQFQARYSGLTTKQELNNMFSSRQVAYLCFG